MYHERIKEAFKGLKLTISDKQAEDFVMYCEMLIEWNRMMNLTAITEFEEILLKHFIDSASISLVMDMNQIQTVIDVGTGAGFPGIPLKIIYPHLQITLLDSLNKRIQFLNAVIDKLKMENVQAIHGRAEDFGHNPDYREQYDLCVSRAVANLSTLTEYCAPFIKVGGVFVSYKAGEVEEEVNQAERAISSLHLEKAKLEKITLPGSDISRTFVQIKKRGRTDKKYPRKAGLPSKSPL